MILCRTPPLYNNQVAEVTEVIDTGLVQVTHYGSCTYKRTMQYKIPCAVNIADFPFDTHTCGYQYKQTENWQNR